MRPKLINLALLCVVIATALLYFPLNHSTANAHILTNRLDGALPLVPILVIPYVASLLIFWGTVIYAFLTDRNFKNLAIILILIFGLSALIYWLFPTQMPRPPEAKGLVNFVYEHDRPLNDLPSGHAAMAAVLALYFWQKGRRLRIAASAFAVSVVLAAVLIKQHSILGAAGGVVLAMLVWFGIKKLSIAERQ